MPCFLPLTKLLVRAMLLLAAGHALAGQPPPPYTPVKATRARFACLGRETGLGPLLLPTQVEAAGKPLLAAPVRLVSQPDLFAGLQGKATVVEASPDSARWEWKGETPDFRLRAEMSGDCDGFCWYQVTLEPKHPVTVRSLALEIPRRGSTARYLHTARFAWSNVSQGLPELGGSWVGGFVPYLWLGDEERGLAWCAESAQGWRLREPTRCLSVQTEGQSVRLRVKLVDHESLLTEPLTLRFGLQASPVKPVSFAWRAQARMLHSSDYQIARTRPDGTCALDGFRANGVRTLILHDMWPDYYGQLTPGNPAWLRETIAACHQRGIRLLLYVGYGVARQAPELQIAHRHDDWSVLPLIPWVPSYRPETRAFDATCSRSGWADWAVAGIDRLFGEYDLDGLYFDGTSEAFFCHNQAHGCGWLDENGKLQGGYPLLATRRLMRRLAETVHRHKPGAILDVHMSASLTLPTLAFCDSCWNGEQFESHTAAERFEVPLHAFRTEFMGWAHGLDLEFLCYENRPFTVSEAIALAWVHGVEVRPTAESLPRIAPLWRALDAFDASAAKWQPYWRGSGAEAEAESIRVSAWTRKSQALLFVSHLQRTNVAAAIRLDRSRLGLKAGALQATDALTGDPVPLNHNRFRLAFTNMNYRVIEIRPAR